MLREIQHKMIGFTGLKKPHKHERSHHAVFTQMTMTTNEEHKTSGGLHDAFLLPVTCIWASLISDRIVNFDLVVWADSKVSTQATTVIYLPTVLYLSIQIQ